MSKQSVNWTKWKQRDSIEKNKDASVKDAQLITSLADEHRRNQYRRNDEYVLKSILERPLFDTLNEGTRKYYKSSKVWLDANPDRCLRFDLREKAEALLERLNVKKAILAKGKVPERPPPPGARTRKAKRPLSQEARDRRRVRAKHADNVKALEATTWLSNPDLLPKKPPGR